MGSTKVQKVTKSAQELGRSQQPAVRRDAVLHVDLGEVVLKPAKVAQEVGSRTPRLPHSVAHNSSVCTTGRIGTIFATDYDIGMEECTWEGL